MGNNIWNNIIHISCQGFYGYIYIYIPWVCLRILFTSPIGNKPNLLRIRFDFSWFLKEIQLYFVGRNPQKSPNYSELMISFGSFTIAARNVGRQCYCQKKHICVKRNLYNMFFWKQYCLSAFPKESDRLLNPRWRIVFPQHSTALAMRGPSSL